MLLKAFEAPQIITRLDRLIEQFAAQRDHRDALVAVLVLTVMNVNPSLDDLLTLWDPAVITHNRFRANLAVKELVSFELGEVRVKSAIAAEFILKRSVDPDSIVRVMIQMARKAEQARFLSARYNQIFVSLMRFSNIEGLVPEAKKKEVIFRYYEAMRTLSSARTNPLFWLQYAIAANVFEAFDRADFNFKNAYSYAAKTNFDTYQVDNHFANFLLKRASRLRKAVNYMEDFRAARKIVEIQMKQESKLDFPFRVARLYFDFAQGLGDVLSVDERAEVGRAASAVVKQIDGLPAGLKSRYDVKECARQLGTLINTTESPG